MIKIFDCILHTDCAFHGFTYEVDDEVISVSIWGGMHPELQANPAHKLKPRSLADCGIKVRRPLR